MFLYFFTQNEFMGCFFMFLQFSWQAITNWKSEDLKESSKLLVVNKKILPTALSHLSQSCGSTNIVDRTFSFVNDYIIIFSNGIIIKIRKEIYIRNLKKKIKSSVSAPRVTVPRHNNNVAVIAKYIQENLWAIRKHL